MYLFTKFEKKKKKKKKPKNVMKNTWQEINCVIGESKKQSYQ